MIADTELLRQYREADSQEAFDEIVARHLDLVYSVAYRQLGEDEHLASDVCQEVFLTLARKAKSLEREVVLAGWLYRSALYAAKSAGRRERRRRLREASTMRESEAGRDEEIDWERVRPLLDWAICELSEKDRDAICLRFFENCSYSNIGERLDASENASRMRVNRALEKLNGLLASRGVRSTGTALGLALGGQAGVSAPVGLAASITQCVAASVAAGTSGSAAGMAFGFMNPTKAMAGLAAAVSALTVGVAVYESERLDAAQAELADLEGRRSGGEGDGELEDLRSTLAAVSAELARLTQDDEDAKPLLAFTEEEFEEALAKWTLRVSRISEYLDANMAFWIPEMGKLTMRDWLEATKAITLESEADYRMGLLSLRTAARHKSVPLIADALRAYLEESGGTFPSEPEELIPYSDGSLDEATLARFRVSPPGDLTFNYKAKDEAGIVEWDHVDPIWDSYCYVSKRRAGVGNSPGLRTTHAVASAKSRFETERGRSPSDGEELLPYLAADTDSEMVSEILQAMSRRPQLPSDESDE